MLVTQDRHSQSLGDDPSIDAALFLSRTDRHFFLFAVMAMYESYAEYRGDGANFEPDPVVLKKLRLLIETDDQQFPALKKLKICGMDLSDLPPEVFEMVELEVRE